MDDQAGREFGKKYVLLAGMTSLARDTAITDNPIHRASTNALRNARAWMRLVR